MLQEPSKVNHAKKCFSTVYTLRQKGTFCSKSLNLRYSRTSTHPHAPTVDTHPQRHKRTCPTPNAPTQPLYFFTPLTPPYLHQKHAPHPTRLHAPLHSITPRHTHSVTNKHAHTQPLYSFTPLTPPHLHQQTRLHTPKPHNTSPTSLRSRNVIIETFEYLALTGALKSPLILLFLCSKMSLCVRLFSGRGAKLCPK